MALPIFLTVPCVGLQYVVVVFHFDHVCLNWISMTVRNTTNSLEPLSARFRMLMPRSHIHGSPRRFYYGINLTDDPGKANFRSPLGMHYIRMIKYHYV